MKRIGVLLLLVALGCSLPVEETALDPLCYVTVTEERFGPFGDSTVQAWFTLDPGPDCGIVPLTVNRGHLSVYAISPDSTSRVRWRFHNDTGRVTLSSGSLKIYEGVGPFHPSPR